MASNLKVNLINMAFRNLARHKVKTIITSIAVAIGVALYIWMDAWLLGMNIDSQRNIVNYEVGSSKIYSKAYFDNKDNMPMYETFYNYQEIVDNLDKNGFNSTPRMVFGGSLISINQENPFMFIGVNPDLEKKMFSYHKFVKDGRFIENGKFEILLGDRGAKNLEVKIGDTVRLSTVIDKKVVPDRIKKEPFIEDIIKKLDENEKKIVDSNYYLTTIEELESKVDYYILKSDISNIEKDKLMKILNKIEFKGLIRHINQLIELTVVGIVNSPNPKTNGNIGYIPLDILQDEMGLLLEGGITEICIRKKGINEALLPDKSENIDVVKNILSSFMDVKETKLTVNGNKKIKSFTNFDKRITLNDDLILISWQEDVIDYLNVAAGDNVGNRLIIIILFVISFVGIANTMLMAVLERTKEIGMLRSMGMTDTSIVRLFFYEAGFIGFIGSMCGIIVGILLNIYMVNVGIDFSKMMENFGTDYGYRIVGYFKSAWNFKVIIASGIIATIISAMTAILPSLRAVKITIVEALRFE
ncbi:MAG TPA: FtsX-like permease family protein [Spirochaetota bacterium]|nr:FtsX-like permease family protein [Spirochaetota bacterium]